MGIKSSAFHRSELPAFSLLTVHREPWMTLTKAFCWTPLGQLPRQQLAGSGVTLTTFIPSRPLAPNAGCQSHKLPAFALIPWDMSDLSTCFCSIKAISHLANGTDWNRGKQDRVQPQRQTQERKWEWIEHREWKREWIMEILICWCKALTHEAVHLMKHQRQQLSSDGGHMTAKQSQHAHNTVCKLTYTNTCSVLGLNYEVQIKCRNIYICFFFHFFVGIIWLSSVLVIQ